MLFYYHHHDNNNLPKTDLLKALRRLFTNRIWTGNLFNAVFTLLGVSGYWSFKPKYMENQFRKSATDANYFTGEAVGFSFAGGVRFLESSVWIFLFFFINFDWLIFVYLYVWGVSLFVVISKKCWKWLCPEEGYGCKSFLQLGLGLRKDWCGYFCFCFGFLVCSH